MGLIRLKIRELAAERNWTIKEVSERSGVVYSTLKTYTRSAGMATVDLTAVMKIARVFGVTVEELVEMVEE
ncbi:helix-turn-helix transcriptional regulator [Sphaerothrix gracilis]|uniref:helix-turn-helix domain-containing protein n=1 Tax=Sphaerothrix gracilis TaxID=3151835 RepID=UPI0031FBDE77